MRCKKISEAPKNWGPQKITLLKLYHSRLSRCYFLVSTSQLLGPIWAEIHRGCCASYAIRFAIANLSFAPRAILISVDRFRPRRFDFEICNFGVPRKFLKFSWTRFLRSVFLEAQSERNQTLGAFGLLPGFYKNYHFMLIAFHLQNAEFVGLVPDRFLHSDDLYVFRSHWPLFRRDLRL